MSYRETILKLITEDGSTAFLQWLQKQPQILQPEILKTFECMIREIIPQEDLASGLYGDMEKLSRFNYDYEQAVIDEQLADVRLKMAVLARTDVLKKWTEKLLEYVNAER
jgi:hypothetical protein